MRHFERELLVEYAIMYDNYVNVQLYGSGMARDKLRAYGLDEAQLDEVIDYAESNAAIYANARSRREQNDY